MNTQKPETVIRIGNVSASIFTRNIGRQDEIPRLIRSVNLQKRYVENGESKFSSSFGLNELPQAITALKLALQRVAEQEAVVAEESVHENF